MQRLVTRFSEAENKEIESLRELKRILNFEYERYPAFTPDESHNPNDIVNNLKLEVQRIFPDIGVQIKPLTYTEISQAFSRRGGINHPAQTLIAIQILTELIWGEPSIDRNRENIVSGVRQDFALSDYVVFIQPRQLGEVTKSLNAYFFFEEDMYPPWPQPERRMRLWKHTVASSDVDLVIDREYSIGRFPLRSQEFHYEDYLSQVESKRGFVCRINTSRSLVEQQGFRVPYAELLVPIIWTGAFYGLDENTGKIEETVLEVCKKYEVHPDVANLLTSYLVGLASGYTIEVAKLKDTTELKKNLKEVKHSLESIDVKLDTIMTEIQNRLSVTTTSTLSAFAGAPCKYCKSNIRAGEAFCPACGKCQV